MTLRHLAALLALAGVTSAAPAGPVLDRIKAKGGITLAHRESSSPFSFLDSDK